ncbi:uncharacterized protein BKA78DRAFT_355023 [Phyllosticta capitalensis]|uniref:uncharacterized protein n=1 Tax=Phyllosticta capitalensis TaxID=121624 RepID=UPI0031310A05
MPKKNVKLSLGLKIDADSYYQKTVNGKTGETKVIHQQQPVQGTVRSTITTRPLKLEHSCSSEPRKTEHHSTWTPKSDKESRTSENEAKKGEQYNSSALFQ